MIHLPALERLDVDRYGLYPGTAARPGLHVEFKPGMTLVLGANGLGKTTLVTLLYRLLTGPVDIPTLDIGGELGGRRLDTRVLQQPDRAVFAKRVMDGAGEARARLAFSLGEMKLDVTRDMRTLDVTEFVLNGKSVEASREQYEGAVLAGSGLSTFADWILALRHLVFYFEDRRALVWDASAQRQLLRLLFLPPEQSREWTVKERAVLELDSLVRNLQYSLNKEQKIVSRAKQALGSADEVRQQLTMLQRIQADEQDRLDADNDRLVDVAAERQLARIKALTAEQAHESALRAVERLQLGAVASAFPESSTTARYILGQILAEEHCLTCGNIVPEFRRVIEERIAVGQCPICASNTGAPGADGASSTRALARAVKQAQETETHLAASAIERQRAEQIYDELLGGISDLTSRVARRTMEMTDLGRQLPPDQREVETHRSELATLNSRLEQRRSELAELRENFKEFVVGVNLRISQRKEAIKAAFDSYAQGFLFEDCTLVWSPRKSRVGETGELVEFAAFELDLTGADFPSPVRRTGPGQVSESQREFIDLSFRMALMQVATDSGATLVVDAPESSLDAVFVSRAAEVLDRFSAGKDNRLITTSNLIDGDLIPHLVQRAGIQSPRDSRVVDLLRIAAPTAAVRNLHNEYAQVRRRLFERPVAAR